MSEWIVCPNAGSRLIKRVSLYLTKKLEEWKKKTNRVAKNNEQRLHIMNRDAWIELNWVEKRSASGIYGFLFSLQLYGCCRLQQRLFYSCFLTHFEKNSLRRLEHHELFRMKEKEKPTEGIAECWSSEKNGFEYIIIVVKVKILAPNTSISIRLTHFVIYFMIR